MPHYILVTESGSDIYPDSAERYGVHIVPMHVNFDDATRNDDSFPPKELYESYKATGRPPKTSGSNPEDFTKVFDEIHAA
jgi:fatty acid-binding protein DegV